MLPSVSPAHDLHDVPLSTDKGIVCLYAPYSNFKERISPQAPALSQGSAALGDMGARSLAHAPKPCQALFFGALLVAYPPVDGKRRQPKV